ncbi:MAG: UbiA family prenyltransferase [Candidatus Hodarchaeales archaeon]|jgi:4-hydroxybenzoate polyprenyltransferase
MNKKQLRAIFDLFRFTLGFLSSLAVLSAGFIVFVLSDNPPDFGQFFFNNNILAWHGLLLGLLATMLLTWAIQAINDYYDIETDIANKRYDRPLARGDLDKNFVRNLVMFMFSLATCIIAYIVIIYKTTVYLFLFTLVFIGIGIGYNLGVKRTGFIGNIWVSSGYVAPLFMGFFMLNPTNQTALLACLIILNSAFFLSVGREIVKDIQDHSGDKILQLNSLAVKYGPEKAGYIAMIFFAIALVSSVIAGLIIYQNIVFWFFVLFFSVTLVLTSYTILTEKSKGGKKARKYTRWSLWIALGAFFFGIFFVPQP